MSILKKTILILTACIMTMTIAVGCGNKKDEPKEEKNIETELIEKDDKDNKKNTKETEEETTEKEEKKNDDKDKSSANEADSDLVGTWYYSNILAEGIELSAEAYKNITGEELDMSIEFTSDGMAVFTASGETEEFPYDADGDVLLEKDGSKLVYDKSDNTVTFSDDESGMDIVFRKEGDTNVSSDSDTTNYDLSNLDNWDGGDVDLADVEGEWTWVSIEAEGMSIKAEEYAEIVGQEMSMDIKFSTDGKISVIINGEETTEDCTPEGNLMYDEVGTTIKYDQTNDIMVFEEPASGMVIIFERK